MDFESLLYTKFNLNSKYWLENYVFYFGLIVFMSNEYVENPTYYVLADYEKKGTFIIENELKKGTLKIKTS